MGGSKSTLWYNAMKNEIDSILTIKSGILLSYPKKKRPLVVNGFLKLKEILLAILVDIK